MSWRDYVMSVLGDLVGVLCGSWLFDNFFLKVESQGLLMRLGLQSASLGHSGHSSWGLFNLCLNNVTRPD